MQRIHVMVGVITRGQEILIAKRPPDVHQGDRWEFPGGKLEVGETPEAGLQRELLEELDIDVREAKPCMQISHDYTEKQVLLDVWIVSLWRGIPRGLERQEIRWVLRSELPDYEFPVANKAIVEYLLNPKTVSV